MESLESRQLLATVPLTVTITGVGVTPAPSSAVKFYAAVTIDGVRQESPRQSGSSLFVNWPITRSVDDGAPKTVKIELFDENPDPDAQIDIDPGPDQSIDLLVDPLTGAFVGDAQLPLIGGSAVSSATGNLSFFISIPGVTTDSDGDGLLDGWEKNGLDLDVNRSNGVDLPLNTWGAKFDHKDLFLELDWMAGNAPQRAGIQAMKAAFAAAPITAGINAAAIGGVNAVSNPDGQPGINLWVDTGGLMEGGLLVGDNLGGGSQIADANISNLNANFSATKAANFNALRRFAFRYSISSMTPANLSGTSSGSNNATTLNDTAQNWVTNEWAGYTVTINGGIGSGQTGTIVSNTNNQLVITAASMWSTTPDNTSTYTINWSSGGWGETGGNDFIEYNHDGGTIMHELGHTLNLRHGGSNDSNCKPNFISVMNYDLQFGIPQNNGTTIIDYSPPRHANGRGVGPLPSLVENNLLETMVLDPNDPSNRMVFTNSNGRKSQWPLRGANRGGDPAFDGPDYNANNTLDTAPLTGGINIDGADTRGTASTADDSPQDCINTTTNDTLDGHDDWSRISLPFRQFAKSAAGVLSPPDRREPTLKEMLELQQILNTTDLEVSITDAPDPVDQGSELVYVITVRNLGPNPSDGVVLTDTLPAGVEFVSAVPSQGTATGNDSQVTAQLGTILPGLKATLTIKVIPCLVGDNANKVTVSSGDMDSNPANDTATAHTTVRNVAPEITFAGLSKTEIDENGSVDLTVRFKDPAKCDTHKAKIVWADGKTDTFNLPAGAREFSRSHQYLDDDPMTGTPQDSFIVMVTVTDNNGDSDSESTSPLVVKNDPPVVTEFTSDAMDCGDNAEGDAIHVMGTFTDVGTLDTHTAKINWGDGKPATDATIVEGGGAGTIAGTHVYTAGGIYRIEVKLTDDDTGATTDRTFALVTGVGILNGQLQVVGTKQADQVQVNRTGNGKYMAHASFLANSPRSLPAVGVTSIAMFLCDGDDQATIASNIDLPAFISGDGGNDQLNGGNGPNILLGGAGNDKINGGSSHDILVGGTGGDRIVGNGGDDILIAGTLGDASDPINLLDEMFAILGQWSQNRNRMVIRPMLIIRGDDDADVLTGSAGDDWFFADLAEDKVTDLKNEWIENIG